jgi:hypothetical protein
MIRPFTLFCFLLACGSGLYLYQSKHRAQMMDREIEKTVHATEALRDQSRLLNAEWMLLNDPERLRALADQFLALRTVQPSQFTTMADLDRRLPPVRSPDAPLEPVPEPAVMPPMVPMTKGKGEAPVAVAPAEATPAAATPAPAASPAQPSTAQPSTTQPSTTQPAPRPAPLVAERKSAPERPAPERPAPERPAPERPAPRVVAQADPRPIEPRYTPPRIAAMPRYTPPVATAQAAAPFQTGSALGMAATSSLPPPKAVSLFPASDH